MALKTPILLFRGNFTHKQFIQIYFTIAKQIKIMQCLACLLCWVEGIYSTRQGSEDQSEAALSVTDAAKLGISWKDLTAFCLEVLHFNILFFLRHLSFNYLNNLLVYNSENLYNFFRLWFQFWLPPVWKKVTRKYFNVAFWGKAK